jgi:protoporphyrin/coproporphyrin ferrochelatase
MTKVAVVLFNLGGPDSQAAVEPFLFNLFSDRAIIALPQPLRWLAAKLISARRAPVAREIYAKIGGASPLLANTKAQAIALERALGEPFRCFIAMRYWSPRADETARAVKAWGVDEIVLAPLYPQYSTTTTGSSLTEWRQAARRAGLSVPTSAICCYPADPGLVAALAARVREGIAAIPAGTPARVLFSAHGLPEKVVKAGDPYQWQVERTAASVVDALDLPSLDHVVCYQSQVGPLAWLKPSTDAEIARAGADRVALVVVPISFVSEHSETLVELDIEYRHLAERSGVPAYIRVGTVDASSAFIESLAEHVRKAHRRGNLISGDGGRSCPTGFRHCAFAGAR